MRAAHIKEHPIFPLMKQSDIQRLYYMQMPRWLFSDPRYMEMSLDAKVTYTFLLNRFQLSRRKGWVNEEGEVFVIFPRKALAQELQICEKRVIAAFRKLAELQLIWEKRCGRGDANQIYLACVAPQIDPEYECVPFNSEGYEQDSARTADMTALEDAAPAQEPPNRQFKNGENGGARTADNTVPELPDLPPSKIEIKQIKPSQKEVSQSVGGARAQDGSTDDERELMDILDACELSSFSPGTAQVFENAIERLFYSDSFRIGNATLPRCRVRAKLRLLNWTILQDAEGKLAANLEKNVKNSTAYTMATVFNCIAESESDLLVDPYLNSLRVPEPVRRC